MILCVITMVTSALVGTATESNNPVVVVFAIISLGAMVTVMLAAVPARRHALGEIFALIGLVSLGTALLTGLAAGLRLAYYGCMVMIVVTIIALLHASRGASNRNGPDLR
jgi:hypothetical protein